LRQPGLEPELPNVLGQSRRNVYHRGARRLPLSTLKVRSLGSKSSDLCAWTSVAVKHVTIRPAVQQIKPKYAEHVANAACSSNYETPSIVPFQAKIWTDMRGNTTAESESRRR
jgi:hypothetical protein